MHDSKGRVEKKRKARSYGSAEEDEVVAFVWIGYSVAYKWCSAIKELFFFSGNYFECVKQRFFFNLKILSFIRVSAEKKVESTQHLPKSMLKQEPRIVCRGESLKAAQVQHLEGQRRELWLCIVREEEKTHTTQNRYL